jgi:hypothetical protein
MRRTELEHIIRAAGDVLGEDTVISPSWRLSAKSTSRKRQFVPPKEMSSLSMILTAKRQIELTES